MAATRKRLHALSIVGLVFMMFGVIWIVVGKPAIAATTLPLGVVLFCVGVATARKTPPPGDEQPPPAV